MSIQRTHRNAMLFLLATLLLILAACSSQTTGTTTSETSPKPTGTSSEGQKIIYIPTFSPTLTVSPINNQGSGASTIVISLFNDPLYDLNDNLEFVPKLAKSIETKDNQTFIFKLDPAAKWSDGQPFTADDVAFTLQTALNAKVDTTFNFSFIEGLNAAGKLDSDKSAISGIKVIDSTTFELKTKQPIALTVLQERFANKIYFIPKHILKDVPVEQINAHPYFQNPEVTIGPFKFVKFVKGAYVEVAKNTSYYRGVPKLDKIFFKDVAAETILPQLQTGELHMNTLPFGTIPITELEKVKALPNFDVSVSESAEPLVAFFNTETVPLKVRQAIPYALNRELLVSQLLKGQGSVVDGPIPANHPNYNKRIELFTYQPDKAKALLKESNWDVNKPLRVLIPTGNAIRQHASELLVENLEKSGFKVQAEKYDYPSLIAKVRKFDYDIAIYNTSFFIDPSSYFSNLKSDSANNYTRYKNPQADELITLGESETDPAKRKVIYDQLQEIHHTDLPHLSLYTEKKIAAVSKKVLVGKPLRLGMFNNVNEWDLK
ncbi:peptide ABC transporter substrate-binding protein [Paenibacillus marchantiophytorum]|uniref:Peptide ABC transporter substrate-binding protein n=1 Tax=Paenibacillus marchantiophytorum TaxID=1619310 RepID=A0ABQ2BQZ7_9BACL|nr:ABC transporter substrate-binding protein [Paenibacillus marchantiophytorum]GGI45487.1 peptide ABC transporter substrate-binding protein [Paenibacillus marchantiophytorum]